MVRILTGRLVFLLLVILTACGGNSRSSSGGARYGNGTGARKKIMLPDGTAVTLNANSFVQLGAQFGKSERAVSISGDVLFQVSPRSKPFVIHTPHMLLQADSGLFRVSAFEGMAGEETSLLSGRVRATKNYDSRLETGPYILHAGEMMMMNRDIDLVEVETADTSFLRRWIDDRIQWNHASVRQVMDDLESWYGIQVQSNRVPGDVYFSGSLYRAGLEEVLHRLSNTWKCRYAIDGSKVSFVF